MAGAMSYMCNQFSAEVRQVHCNKFPQFEEREGYLMCFYFLIGLVETRKGSKPFALLLPVALFSFLPAKDHRSYHLLRHDNRRKPQKRQKDMR